MKNAIYAVMNHMILKSLIAVRTKYVLHVLGHGLKQVCIVHTVKQIKELKEKYPFIKK